MVVKPRILLVNPRCLDERIAGEDAAAVPIGLYYIAALLRDKAYDATILNLAGCDGDPVQVFRQSVKQLAPNIIGFSVMNPNRWNAVECARWAKKSDPSVKIVFGGPAATFMTESLFKNCPELDFAVRGEGELSFLELAGMLAQNDEDALAEIPGIAYKKDGKIIRTEDRDLCPDLDILPHPSRYFTYPHLSMSRGCPGNCTFCGSPKFWGQRKVRFHSPEWFAEEVNALARKGVRHFFISDDTFTMDKEKVIEFCSLLEKNTPGITWNAISRVDFIDADILYAMRKAGCIQISYGVESGAEKIRKVLGKPIEEKKIIDAFALTRRYGILPRAYFIYGSPGETRRTISDSIGLMKKIMPLSAIFYMLTLFPGTYLYRQALQKEKISDRVWDQKIEDVPWFEVDNDLDFKQVKDFGDRLRTSFYENVGSFALDTNLIDQKDLYPFHADFLSRLAMTFSHGEYATNPQVMDAAGTAKALYEKALTYAPDPRAFMGLGMLLQKHGLFEDALALLEKGTNIFPDHPDLNICMGLCRMNTGRFDLALKVFEKFRDLPQTGHYIQICKEKLQVKP